MIKVVLLILLMTSEGPQVFEVAEFDPAKRGYCDAVGRLVVANVRKQKNVTAALYRCVDRTYG